MASNDTHRAAVIEAVKAEFRSIAGQHMENQQRLRELEERAALIHEDQRWLSEQASRCYATAVLFNFDLASELATDANRAPKSELESAAIAGELAQAVVGQPTVKEFILEEARLAAPNPVRAAELRKSFETRFGKKVHYKTFGMSLYRLATQEGAVRREGHSDWYFVPPDQRAKQLEMIRLLGEDDDLSGDDASE